MPNNSFIETYGWRCAYTTVSTSAPVRRSNGHRDGLLLYQACKRLCVS
jgi:hypothetical protein